MSMYITMVFDFYIKKEYHKYISNVYKTKSWYEFPSADIWEKLDYTDLDSRMLFFPWQGSWDESSGRISFVSSYNHYSYKNINCMEYIFCRILPRYSEEGSPFYYSCNTELDEPEERLFDINNNRSGIMKNQLTSVCADFSEYEALVDSWESDNAYANHTDNTITGFIIYNGTLYPRFRDFSYYRAEANELISNSKIRTVSELFKHMRCKGGKLISVSEIMSGNDSVIIPSGVDYIGKHAFRGMKNIRRAEIPEGVRCIGASAFENCVNLRSVELPQSIQEIGERAFCGSGLEEIVLPNTIEYIKPYSFFQCKNLKRVLFHSGLKYVGKRAFAFCSALEEISLPSTIKEIHWGAFCGCDTLKRAVIPMGLEVIGYNVFSKCTSMAEITIPRSVRYIGDEQSDNRLVDFCGYDKYGDYSEDKIVFPEQHDSSAFTIKGTDGSTAHYYSLFHNLIFEVVDK